MRVRVVAALFGLLAVLAPQVSAQVSNYTAHAVLHPFFNSSIANTAQQPFAGTVDFFQNGDGTGLVNITINVMGLNPGANYSIFVHQYGNLAGYIQDPTVGSVTVNNTLFNVGPHFNPFNQMHGCGVGNPRHAGDIGNVSIPAGSNISTWTTIQLQSELLDLGLNMNYTNASIIGRAVVLREMPDTCSQDDTQLGGYLALGVIGVGPAPLNKAVANSQPIDNTNSAPKAVAIIFDQSNTPPNPPKPVGYVYFWTDMNNNTHMRGAVYGFKALSVHGIHIHGSGDEDNNNTISGHWTGPSNTVHGLPPNSTRHWGDLGNVVADSTGVITFNDIWAPLNLISVWNSINSILGRAIAIHEAVDDGTTTTYGPRYRFGVIGLADPTFPIPAVPMPVYPTVARAQVIFRPFFNNTNVTWPDAPLVGNITFTQNVNGTGNVNVTVMVAGLRGNHEYGLHIHQYGNEINSFDHTTGLPITTWANLGNATDPITGGVGGHFNPFNQPHGCFGNPARHAGDIGNVSVRNIGDGDRFTVFTYNLTSELLDLGRDSINNNSIIGRTVTLHDMPNPCDGVTPLGNWIAIGVIGIDTTTISVDETQNLAQQEMLTFNPANNSPKANAVIRDFRAPGGQIVGDVFFWSGSMGEIRMSGAVAGFAPNSSHGVHIHQFGNENSNVTIGPHWAAPGQDGNVFHQLPPYAGRHYGDIIGSLTADANGVVTFFNYSAGFDLLSLTQSSNSIIGHSIAFHEMADTGSATSYGPRYRFGVIGLVSPDFPIPTNLTAPLPPNPNQGPTASPPPPTATPTPAGSGGNGTNGGNTTTTPTTPAPTNAPTNGTTAAPNATTAPPTSNPPSTGATATVSHMLLAAVVALGVVAAL